MARLAVVTASWANFVVLRRRRYRTYAPGLPSCQPRSTPCGVAVTGGRKKLREGSGGKRKPQGFGFPASQNVNPVKLRNGNFGQVADKNPGNLGHFPRPLDLKGGFLDFFSPAQYLTNRRIDSDDRGAAAADSLFSETLFLAGRPGVADGDQTKEGRRRSGYPAATSHRFLGSMSPPPAVFPFHSQHCQTQSGGGRGTPPARW